MRESNCGLVAVGESEISWRQAYENWGVLMVLDVISWPLWGFCCFNLGSAAPVVSPLLVIFEKRGLGDRAWIETKELMSKRTSNLDWFEEFLGRQGDSFLTRD